MFMNIIQCTCKYTFTCINKILYCYSAKIYPDISNNYCKTSKYYFYGANI